MWCVPCRFKCLNTWVQAGSTVFGSLWNLWTYGLRGFLAAGLEGDTPALNLAQFSLFADLTQCE